MYRIDVNTTKADIPAMEKRVNEFMQRGIRIGNLNEMHKHYLNLREQLKDDIVQKYGIANPNSSQQIVAYLKDLASRVEMSANNDIINICMDAETGKWTSNANAMESLADLGYDIGTDILEYRLYKKYAESISELLSFADGNNLIHPFVTLTKTNRISYVRPAIMNIPKKLLWSMIAPYNSSDVLYSVDIKNQEPSILINSLGDDDLAKVLESDKGLYEELFERVFTPTVELNMVVDFLPENRVYSIQELRNIPFVEPAKYLPKRAECKSIYFNNERIIAIETLCHGYTGGEIKLPETVVIQTDKNELYNVPVKWNTDIKPKKGKDFTITGTLQGIEFRLSKAERKEFKVAWNALSYGASSFGIEKMCKIIDGKKVYKYFNNLDSFKRYKKQIDNIVKAGGNTVNTLFGNYVSAGIGKEDVKALKRALLDLPIQGTGADILSCLIKHFEEEIVKRGLEKDMFIYYTRHDELIIEVSKDIISRIGDNGVTETLRDILEHQIVYKGKDWEPFKVEIGQVVASDGIVEEEF